uniref:Tripartite motif-containing protein 16-like n=1 Tax=Sander lucioperca TaxID=283035 RepID=A0A8C9YAH1_SANLU
MEPKRVKLDRDAFSCSICLDLLSDPVTTSCEHSYCTDCIKSFWDKEDDERIYSCPQCGQIFIPRPILVKNTTLADLQRLQEREKEVTLFQPEMEAINRSADKAVEDSEKIFAELIRLIEKRSADVKEQIRSNDAELTELLHTEDHNQFLHNYPSLSPLSEPTDSSSINIRPLRYFEDVTAAVSNVREKLQDFLSEAWTNISLAVTDVDVLLSQPEPQTRAEFLKCSHKITLDPNTAHTQLSVQNRGATFMKDQQSFSHPDRFTSCRQVLSTESLTGRRYFEVQWSGIGVCVAVTYKDGSRFGNNDKSWSLSHLNRRLTFQHNNVHTSVSGPWSSRVGVYLDHSRGLLSFYSVSETMTLLHRVQTTFTQPLYAGFRFDYSWGDSATFCELNLTDDV